MQISNAQPCQRGRPVERSGDAGDFGHLFFLQHIDPARHLQGQTGVNAGSRIRMFSASLHSDKLAAKYPMPARSATRRTGRGCVRPTGW